MQLPQPHNIMIHEFDAKLEPCFDDEGDQMIGFYFQFTDQDDRPVCELVGPYRHKSTAEHAAMRAFNSRDF